MQPTLLIASCSAMCTYYRWARARNFGSGMNGVVNTILGGWQTAGALTLKEGFPLTIASSGNGLNYFGAGQHVFDESDRIRKQGMTRAAVAMQPGQDDGEPQ